MVHQTSTTTSHLPPPQVLEPDEDENSLSEWESDMDIDISDSSLDSCHANHLMDQLKQLNKKFRMACLQVVLLNNALESLNTAHERADKYMQRGLRYFLKLKSSTLEGVRNVFYEYCCRTADKLDVMHEQLLREGIIETELNLEELNNEDII